tara:strand:+ start:1853 stop:2962 length:1110 start_codon:yes stop_codon:yes gene_type:complete
MQKVFNLGVIGGSIKSTIGQTHFISSKLDGKWKFISGVFSRNSKDNIKSAIKYGIDKKRIYKDIPIFLKKEKSKIDAILLLTDTPSHVKILKKIFSQSIPVICEKPLFSNKNEVKKLEKFVKQKQFLRVTYNYSGYPLIREIKKIIKKRKIGEIKQFNFEMIQDSFVGNISKNIKPKKWRLKDGFIPNLSHDLGSHLIYLCFYLFDKFPTKVNAKYFSSLNFKNLIDNGYFWLNLNKKIYGKITLSKTIYGSRNDLILRITGDKGSVLWKHTNPEQIIFTNEKGVNQILDRGSSVYEAKKNRYNRYKVGHPDGFLEAFANIYGDIYEDLIDYKNGKKEKNFNDLKISKKIVNFFDKASYSNKYGKWINI